jgi:hypothetical protein
MSPIITADLPSEQDGGVLRLASPACEWTTIAPQDQTGPEAAITIFDAVVTEANALLRQLEAFTAQIEAAAYDQAMSDSLDVTAGIQAHDTCGCGEPIALWEDAWHHVYFSKRC